MAIVKANVSFSNTWATTDGPILTEMFRQGSMWEYYDNQPFALDGISYPDTYRVLWPHEDLLTDLLGKRIEIREPTGAITGGTVTGMVHAFASHGDWWIGWSIQKLSLSAKSLYKTGLTGQLHDDKDFIRHAFSHADRFELSDKSDNVFRYEGNDRIEANGGADYLRGNEGVDKLAGGKGQDWLDGGEGQDALTGGAGSDTFVFLDRDDAGDKITDFESNDKIAINEWQFEVLGWPWSIEVHEYQFQVSADNVALSNDIRLIFRTTDATLWFDSNGTMDGGLTLIADLQAGAVVTSDNVVLDY